MRDRIRELRRVPARDLHANPANWRVHGQRQREILGATLDRIGYADALIARELPDGSLELIDGHLRVETTPDVEVPVLIVDLDEDEARALLATLDPLTAMAEADTERLSSLLGTIQDEALQSLARAVRDGSPTAVVAQPARDRACCQDI